MNAILFGLLTFGLVRTGLVIAWDLAEERKRRRREAERGEDRSLP